MSEKVKFELEFIIKTSPKVLYNFISTPDGLSEWFAENVNINREGILTFIWDGTEEQAKIISQKRDEFFKFRWLEDGEDDVFVEFRIKIDALTNDVALIVTDFAEEDEMEESKLLWSSQISDLAHTLGGT